MDIIIYYLCLKLQSYNIQEKENLTMSTIRNSRCIRYIIIILVILITSVLSTIPAFTDSFFKLSYDGSIHIARFEAVIQALQHHSLPPLVNFIGLKHTGLSMNGMYPWVSSLIFILPNLLFKNSLVALFVGFIILNFLTIFNTYLLTKFITPKKWIQILGILIYQFSSYHMIVMYSRNALGEALAYAFLPLVLLGCLKIWQNVKNGWLYLGLGMGSIANSHILSLVIATIIIVIFIIIRLLSQKLTYKELIEYVKSSVLAVLISLYTLTNIITLTVSNFLINPIPKIVPIMPKQMWQSLLENGIQEKSISFNLGPVNTIILIALLLMLITGKQGNWRNWIIATSILFFGTFSWFPWQLLSNTPVELIQFLGRLLFVVSLLLAVSVVYYFEENPLSSYKDIVLFVGGSLIFVSLSAVHTYHTTSFKDGFRFKLTNTNYNKMIQNSSIGLDYLPANSKLQAKKRIPYFQKDSSIYVKSVSQNYNQGNYKIQIKKSNVYTLPIAIYSNVNYQIVLNNKNVYRNGKGPLKLSLTKKINTLSVTASVNTSHYITMIISLVTIVWNVLALCLYKLKQTYL